MTYTLYKKEIQYNLLWHWNIEDFIQRFHTEASSAECAA
ncbi:hypothetical protein TNCV_558521, partial [Trichonephila clavipes]